MEVRAKKALGQHFLTDQSIAKNIVEALEGRQTLEVGPGMGVLTQYLLPRPELALKVIEIDGESVAYLKKHFPKLGDNLIEGDFLKMDLDGIFEGEYSVIGNFPYNISSQIFFKILEHRDRIPEVVCMIQKEVAERIAEKPGTKTYGILSVFLQAWYDIEYLFTLTWSGLKEKGPSTLVGKMQPNGDDHQKRTKTEQNYKRECKIKYSFKDSVH